MLQLKRGRCTKLNISYPLIARQRSAREDFVPKEIKSGGKPEEQLQITNLNTNDRDEAVNNSDPRDWR